MPVAGRSHATLADRTELEARGRDTSTSLVAVTDELGVGLEHGEVGGAVAEEVAALAVVLGARARW